MFLISGGGSGIGSALALQLAGRGKKVLILGRRSEKLQAVAKQNPNIEYLAADLSSAAGRQRVFDRLKDLKKLEGLINNAGTIEPILPVTELSEEAFRTVLATNLEAPLFLIQGLALQLQAGRVLNIGSAAAYFPVRGWAAYCVSKAGLAMLTRCLQLESSSTAFASVMPGIIDTNMQALIRHAQHMEPEKLAFFKRLQAENRLLSTETVACFLCWLLLDVDPATYSAEEWDIYDSRHHAAWLRPPHQVPSLDA